ncbi:MAG TPA: mechanosensitive ion channel domain-containing protein [Vicinamibacterales bacterium]|nr:mechanosensitive ion channel domain-containing protein [Vicinamibacterales bacterium]
MTPAVPAAAFEWRAILTALIPALVLAATVAYFAKRAVERLLKVVLGDHLALSSPAVRGPLRFIALAAFILLASLLVPPAFELVGLNLRTGISLESLRKWGFDNGLIVLFVIVLAYLSVRMMGLVVRRFEYHVSQGTTLDALERAKRARTLGSLVQRVSSAAISLTALLIILDQFGVNIAPVLTGAGIAGLALGFGAQTLVRDIISGFFLILEDQVRVGDVAAINGIGGLVEEINLRTVVLRDEEGAVHVFPNGSITTLANRSKDFSYYVITLAVPYNEQPDRLITLLREVGDGLQKDPRFSPFILDAIEIFGIDGFAEWSMQLKLRIKTVPLKQWEVGRELRKRIRIAFDQAGVHVPFPAISALAAEGRERPQPQ